MNLDQPDSPTPQRESEPYIVCEDLFKIYKQEDLEVVALRGLDLKVQRGEVTGTSVTDRDPATGLWPSDHGGVVLRLRGW